MIVTMAEMFVGICVKFAVPMLISENIPVVHCMCTTGQQCHIATMKDSCHVASCSCHVATNEE